MNSFSSQTNHGANIVGKEKKFRLPLDLSLTVEELPTVDRNAIAAMLDGKLSDESKERVLSMISDYSNWQDAYFELATNGSVKRGKKE